MANFVLEMNIFCTMAELLPPIAIPTKIPTVLRTGLKLLSRLVNTDCEKEHDEN